MNDKLKSKIAEIVSEETGYGLDVPAKLTDKIADLVDSDNSRLAYEYDDLANRYIRVCNVLESENIEVILDDDEDRMEIMGEEHIAISEAVKRMIAWAAPLLGCSVDNLNDKLWMFSLYDSDSYMISSAECPAWLEIMANGKYTPAAVEEGLRDLFVSMLGAKNDNDNDAEPEN